MHFKHCLLCLALDRVIVCHVFSENQPEKDAWSYPAPHFQEAENMLDTGLVITPAYGPI